MTPPNPQPRGAWWYEMQAGPDTRRNGRPVARTARSLRTQQRAYEPIHPTTAFHTR